MTQPEIVDAQVVRKQPKSALEIVMWLVLGLCGVTFVACAGALVMFSPPATIERDTELGKTERELIAELDAMDAAADAGPSLTMATFNECRPGMTLDEVTMIIGQPDSILSESQVNGVQTVMYSWKGGWAANANMIFQNGKLIQKSQFGL